MRKLNKTLSVSQCLCGEIGFSSPGPGSPPLSASEVNPPAIPAIVKEHISNAAILNPGVGQILSNGPTTIQKVGRSESAVGKI